MPSEGVSLRAFTAADLPAYEGWRAAIDAPQYMTRFYPRAFKDEDTEARGTFAWYVITVGHEDVGTVWLEKDDAKGRQATLGILVGRPDLLGAGIGRQSIPLAIARAREMLGFDEVRLNVRVANARAIACYEHCGFSVAAEGSKIGADGEVIEFYEMRLALEDRSD
jgi:RimJ/RimL family protein N-acetyltransferase